MNKELLPRASGKVLYWATIITSFLVFFKLSGMVNWSWSLTFFFFWLSFIYTFISFIVYVILCMKGK